jgi:hypothetical protein
VSLSVHARANRTAWGGMAADYEAAGRRAGVRGPSGWM